MTNKKHSENEVGKIAVIIGGSSGIGQNAASEIAKRGIGVILTYNTHKDGANETVAAIENVGGKAVALPLDAGKSETFASFKDAVAQALKDKWERSTFTYLVNNAGFGEMATIEGTSEELFDRLINVNFKAPFFITQKLLPLLEEGGAIVNTTSTAALHTGIAEGSAAYASAKAGLIVLTRYMAFEFRKRGIRVNAIAPGPTRTRFANDGFEKFPQAIAPIAVRTALGRVGEASDFGGVIVSLLSDEWSWVTGESIEVSGGFNLGFSLF